VAFDRGARVVGARTDDQLGAAVGADASAVVESAIKPVAPASSTSAASRSRVSRSTRPSAANGVITGTNRPLGR
jgi:hypothetical protein